MRVSDTPHFRAYPWRSSYFRADLFWTSTTLPPLPRPPSRSEHGMDMPALEIYHKRLIDLDKMSLSAGIILSGQPLTQLLGLLGVQEYLSDPAGTQAIGAFGRLLLPFWVLDLVLSRIAGDCCRPVMPKLPMPPLPLPVRYETIYTKLAAWPTIISDAVKRHGATTIRPACKWDFWQQITNLTTNDRIAPALNLEHASWIFSWMLAGNVELPTLDRLEKFLSRYLLWVSPYNHEGAHPTAHQLPKAFKIDRIVQVLRLSFTTNFTVLLVEHRLAGVQSIPVVAQVMRWRAFGDMEAPILAKVEDVVLRGLFSMTMGGSSAEDTFTNILSNPKLVEATKLEQSSPEWHRFGDRPLSYTPPIQPLSHLAVNTIRISLRPDLDGNLVAQDEIIPARENIGNQRGTGKPRQPMNKRPFHFNSIEAGLSEVIDVQDIPDPQNRSSEKVIRLDEARIESPCCSMSTGQVACLNEASGSPWSYYASTSSKAPGTFERTSTGIVIDTRLICKEVPQVFCARHTTQAFHECSTGCLLEISENADAGYPLLTLDSNNWMRWCKTGLCTGFRDRFCQYHMLIKSLISSEDFLPLEGSSFAQLGILMEALVSVEDFTKRGPKRSQITLGKFLSNIQAGISSILSPTSVDVQCNTPLPSHLRYLNTGGAAVIYCKGKHGYDPSNIPTAQKQWFTAGGLNTRSCISLASSATVLIIDDGKILLCIGKPKIKCPLLPSLDSELSIIQQFEWRSVQLCRADVFFLAPNTPFFYYNVEPTLLRGVEIFTTRTMLDTICGVYYRAFITPVEMFATFPLLCRIFTFWDSNIRLANGDEYLHNHLPKLESWPELLSMISLGNVLILAKALDIRTYLTTVSPTVQEEGDWCNSLENVARFRAWVSAQYKIVKADVSFSEIFNESLLDAATLLTLYDRQIPRGRHPLPNMWHSSAFTKEIIVSLQRYGGILQRFIEVQGNSLEETYRERIRQPNSCLPSSFIPLRDQHFQIEPSNNSG
ncbi:hypothetical protein B0H14DRAFT_2912946 [Mycena olivaceomarginata]|nr:hypothetical protein B0H14DRAFT_2912946 [Mycena olivaceomarginata]